MKKWTRFLALPSVVIAIGGCVTTQQKPGRTAESEPSALAPHLAQEVSRAEILGQEIYKKDVKGALATDAMLAEGIIQKDARLRGWVVAQTEDVWRVHFVGHVDGKPCELYTVVFDQDDERACSIHRVNPPAPLTGSLAASYAARETAIAAPIPRSFERYNTVVLPARLIGESGWLVYLLAATTKPGEVIFGRHYRFLLSEDGGDIIQTTALTRGDVVVEASDATTLLNVTHIISDTPIETHVFLSLLHNIPITVSIPKDGVGHIWAVAKGEIMDTGIRLKYR